MKIDPNSRFFDRVPDIFHSPFPSADAYADDAFKALLARAVGNGRGRTIGQALITQAGAQPWNHATQMLWKSKASQAGDSLGDVWSRVAWIDRQQDSVAGVLAQVPFPPTAHPEELVTGIAGVALELALNAVGAVRVVAR